MRNFDRYGSWLGLVVLGLFLLMGGLLLAQNQTINPPRKWATSIGGVNFDFIADAVSDGQGGLYVTGYTNSPNFPTTLAGSAGLGYDVFVARYDSLGAVLWSTRYGGGGDDFGNAIARDGAGNLLIAGKLGSNGSFVTDSINRGNNGDILVLKLNGSGGFIGAKRYGGSSADEAVGISTGANNQIVVVGNSSSSDIATTSATYNGTSGDAFILRLRSNLATHWAFRYGGNSFDKANDVVIDANGNIYVAGETGSANFQQTISTYQGSGGAKSFICRFDSLGARAWAQRYGGSGVERGYALDLPSNGGLLVAGYTTSADFPQTISGLGGAGLDAFLIRLNLDGTRAFARRLGGSLDDLAIDLATDATGNIFMAGETQSLNFPSTNSAYKGAGRDQFLAKFGPAGDFVWSIPYGGLQNDFSGGAVTSTAAAVYLAGHTQSTNYPQTLPGTGGNTARGAVLRLRDCKGQDADFTFSDVCEFDTVHFTNTSVRGTSDTIAHRWWFGDGDSSDVIQPTHYYPTPGAYQVMLRVTSPCGVDSFMTKTLHVYPRPRADWTHTLACETRATMFQDSTALDTTLGSFENGWSWTFGNGATSLLQNPTYTYPGPGTFNVILSVSSNHGCTDSESKIVRVHRRPQAGFMASNICLRDTALFADTSQIAIDTLASWAWDFGVNGTTANVQNPTYVYAAADTYAVQLIVTTQYGCTDTIIQAIQVRPLPMVNFGMTAVCWPDAVSYTDSSALVGDQIAGYGWEFGDALGDTLQNTTHSYASAGEYDVVHWVYTASGCADSLLQTLKVNAVPEADFGFQNGCWPFVNQFADSSGVQSDSLVSWAWDFGDGSVDSTMNPSHAYAVADTYAVSLHVSSAFGCRDSILQNVIVFPKPVAAFNPPSVCFPLPVTLLDISTVTGDNINTTRWDFGDGNTANGFITIHSYASAGDYLVTLVTETGSGCLDTIQDTVRIHPQPEAAYGVESVCDGDTVWFSDSSTVSSGSIVQHLYSFGDGNGSTNSNPYTIYGNAGTYITSLSVTSNHNCFNTVVKTVVVHQLPDPQPTVIGYPDICIGDTIHLQELQSFPHYAWETGDTTDAIVVQGRSDWVVLTVIDSNLCRNADSVEVRFHNVPRPNAVITPGPVVTTCTLDSLMLNAGGSYASYAWSDGSTAASRLVTQSGPLSVLVFNGFGCADTSDVAVFTVLPTPAAPTIMQVGQVLSVGTYASYQWYLNGLAIPGATGQSLTAVATGNYTVMVTDAGGCGVLSSSLSLVVGRADGFVGDLQVYPNPFVGEVHLQGVLRHGGLMQIKLYNATGQVVLEISRVVAAGGFALSLDGSSLAAGYYICELTLGGDVMRRALVRN
jgi:PKD repeat protein